MNLIIRTHILTKFHEDQTINPYNENCPPPGGHVFQRTGTIFEHSRAIIRTNLLTKFHEYWTIKGTFIMLTRFYYSRIRKTAPPPSTIFSTNWIHLQTQLRHHLDKSINVTSRILTNWTMNVTSAVLKIRTAPPPGGHVFQPTGTCLELVQNNFGTHFLTNFHEYWTLNVASRVLTRLKLMTDKRRSQKLTISQSS
ncbi:hypothetical protein DPMN_037063 [Dreissena polymorpha]|uniref:Uncharacterized protein n=1 Tax=Dreissena polymorpha TaxID=45954 RepID=A0A9D4RNR5_DREPO|nr:hypothetical protein DPMN_037063 [Dreissena polymorpha]